MLDEETKLAILNAQRNEITEHFIYKKLARSTKDSKESSCGIYLLKEKI